MPRKVRFTHPSDDWHANLQRMFAEKDENRSSVKQEAFRRPEGYSEQFDRTLKGLDLLTNSLRDLALKATDELTAEDLKDVQEALEILRPT